MDTSALIALVDPRDRHHKAARALPLTRDRNLVPWEIWTELCQYVTARYSARDASGTLRSILEGPFEIRPVLTAEESIQIEGKAEGMQTKAKKQGLKPFTYFDLVVCHVAQRFREAIATFDGGIIEAVRGRWFPGARLA